MRTQDATATIGFTLQQIASGLNVSDDTILRRVHSGELKALRFGRVYVCTEQAVIDAIEKGLGSRAPGDAEAALAKSQAAQAAAAVRGESRMNPPVDVVIGYTLTADGKTGEPITKKTTYPMYDTRSGWARSPEQVAKRAAALAEHNRGEEGEQGDAGRRTVIRTLDGQPQHDVVNGINRGALFDGSGDQGANEMVRAIQQARTLGRASA